MADLDAIRKRVMKALDDSGLSRRQVSMDAGLGETYLRDYLSGRYGDISVQKLTALAAALKKSPEWLLSGEGDEAPAGGAEAAEVLSIFPKLSAKGRREVAAYARFQAEQERKQRAKDKG